jgi:hypothetical protein
VWVHEVAGVWDAVGNDGRKMIQFVSRQAAIDKSLVAADTPLMITDRRF